MQSFATWNIQPALYLSLTLYTVSGVYFSIFDFLQAPFLWILFYSSPLKSLTKYLPCASASPSCFCPILLIFSHSHSQLQELSVCEQKQPPQFVFSAGWLHVHQVPLPLHGFQRQDSSSSSTISSAPLFPSLPQGGVNTEYGEYQQVNLVKHVSLCFSCFWEGSRKQKRRKKQARNKRDVSGWGLKRDRKSMRQWVCLRSPLRSENHLRFLFLYFPPFFFLLPPTLSSETVHKSIQAVVAATLREENLEAVPKEKENKKVGAGGAVWEKMCKARKIKWCFKSCHEH